MRERCLGVLGTGKMARALLLGAELSFFSRVLCFSPSGVSARELAEELGAEQVLRVPACDCYLVGCKPQQFKELAGWLRPIISDGPLVISMMAGVSVSQIQGLLGRQIGVVRVMPNLAAELGLSAHAVFFSSEVNSEQKEMALGLLQASGQVAVVEREEMIDEATPVNGSGPAFVFSLAGQMERYLAQLGHEREQAHQLVSATLEGAAALWREKGGPNSDLEKQVQSKGGVTQAAFSVWGGQREVFAQALRAALSRARQMGDGQP